MKIELPYNQYMIYISNFIPEQTANEQLRQIHEQVEIAYHPNPMNPKTKLRRGNAWFSDNEDHIYKYSGTTNNPTPFPPILAEILEVLRERFEPRLNCCLLNYYPDGSVGVGPHTDDDFRSNGADIVGVNYGQSRLFRLTDRNTREEVYDLSLEHGSALVMTAKSQEFFKHEIVKQRKSLGPRLQLSWRGWRD